MPTIKSPDIYTTPAGRPPPGVVSNPANPPYLHTTALFTHVLCLAVTTIAVALRIFTKMHLMKKFRAEDYALVVAQLGFIPWEAMNIAAPGQGHHLWDISVYTGIQIAKYINYVITLYGPLVFFAKLSVLLQLQHIFVTSHRQRIYFVIQASIWANLIFYFVYLWIDIFQCVPRRKIWDPSLPGKCISTGVLLIAPSGINIASDCLILVLPIFLVFRLQMTLKNKLAIGAIFGSGFFAVVASVVRLVYSIKVTHTEDVIRAISPVSLWATAELATVILVATFPTMPRLWVYIRTGDRNAQQYKSGERRSAPYFPHKMMQPGHGEGSSSPRADVPVKGRYRELLSGKDKSRKDELEMQILRTETYEVTSELRNLPQTPQRARL